MFKNESGTFYTKSLFFETNTIDKEKSVYTLKDEDHKGLPSLKRLFFETGDVTGYTLATNHLGGWDHFLKLRELSWFNEYWDHWVKEFEVKMRAESLVRLHNVAKDSNNKDYVGLNKFFLEKGWILPEERRSLKRRGAPSKAQIREAAMEIATEDQMLVSDLLRVTQTTLN